MQTLARRLLAAAALLAPSAALAQSTDPIILVANEGNLEGSLTSMRVNADATLTFVDRVITGTRPTTSQACPGCNTYAVTLSPNGRWAATSHAAGSGGEQITVYEVFSNGTLEVVETLPLVEGGLDIQWLRDDLLAAPVTSSSFDNTISLYTWNADTHQLSFANGYLAGTFLTSLALHPSGRWLYANDSFARMLRIFEVSGNTLALVDTISLPVFGVSLGVTPDGQYLYAAGGISSGGRAFAGYAINQSDGTLTEIAGSPFTSPGASPKGFAFTPDSQYLYVSHGTDATIRAFRIEPEDGVPTDLGFSFDLGLQGTLQGMATLDGLLFACDDSTAFDSVAGAYSFEINTATGDFAPTPGAPTLTQGISPNDIASWAGAPCPADIDNDGDNDADDIALFVAYFLDAIPDNADLDGDADEDPDDIQAFTDAFLAGCE